MAEPAKELPRLTGALRAFGDVSQEFGTNEDEQSRKALLVKKRKRLHGGDQQDWKTLTQQLLGRCSKSDCNEVL